LGEYDVEYMEYDVGYVVGDDLEYDIEYAVDVWSIM